MTKHPPPHQLRTSTIKASFLLIALAAALAMWLIGCSPHNGCKATRGKVGYSWIRCNETGKIIVFDDKGKLVCIYKEKA